MPRANIATSMGTRFPLVKSTYLRHDVAGTVKLLQLSDEDAPRAAQVKLDRWTLRDFTAWQANTSACMLQKTPEETWVDVSHSAARKNRNCR